MVAPRFCFVSPHLVITQAFFISPPVFSYLMGLSIYMTCQYLKCIS